MSFVLLSTDVGNIFRNAVMRTGDERILFTERIDVVHYVDMKKRKHKKHEVRRAQNHHRGHTISTARQLRTPGLQSKRRKTSLCYSHMSRPPTCAKIPPTLFLAPQGMGRGRDSYSATWFYRRYYGLVIKASYPVLF